MPIEVVCPSCDKVYKVPAAHAGKRIKCTACDNVFRVEAGDSDSEAPPLTPPVSEPASPPSAPQMSSTQSAVVSGAFLADDENIEVIDFRSSQDVTIEVISYKRLDGAQRFVDAQALYYAKESGIRFKQVRMTLNNSEVILESGALQFMHGQFVMEDSVGDMAAIGKALKNAFLSEDEPFRPTVKGSGVVHLEPSLEHFLITEVNNEPLIVDRGVFYACEKSVQVGHIAKSDVSTAAGFLGEGWYQTHISGSGLCVLASPVPEHEIRKISLTNETLQVDGNFVLVRSEGLEFSMKSATKGLISKLTSGEGYLQTFQGTGEVWLAPTKPVYEALRLP